MSGLPRRLLVSLWLSGLLGAIPGCSDPPAPPDSARDAERPLVDPERPHLLLITVDALRADRLGFYGYEPRELSPELDRLAAESTVFEHAYTTTPTSAFSMCSLMMGEHLLVLAQLGRSMPERTLPGLLSTLGYRTVGLYTRGIFYDGHGPLARYDTEGLGFEETDHRDLDGERKTDAVLAWLRTLKNDGEPPAFVWAHYFDVHEPYRDTSLGTADRDRYDAGVRVVDRAIGRLLREAREALRRPLVVVLTSDHGEELRDHGGLFHGTTAYEEQMRVPLIVHVPGREAERVERPVSLVDVLPTLVRLGGSDPGATRGQDLVASGDDRPVPGSVGFRRMLVRWPFKLIADGDDRLLFDLAKDPGEQEDLGAAESERAGALSDELGAWLDAMRSPPGQTPATDPLERALDLGRLRDPRATDGLTSLLADREQPGERRAEAASLLAFSPATALRALRAALRDPDPVVAAEAAIALGQHRDGSARRPLTSLLESDDAVLRVRAALALGRLGERAAVRVLVEALAQPLDEEHARRMAVITTLGQLQAREAVDAIVALGTAETRYRYYAATALGRIGDPTAVEPLLAWLAEPQRTTIRDAIVRALGQIGEPRALPRLVELARTDPDLVHTGESLVRLGAAESGTVGGLDIGPGVRGARGLTRCRRERAEPAGEYGGQTRCTIGATRPATLAVPLLTQGPQLLLVRIRADRSPAALRIRLREQTLSLLPTATGWREHRVELPAVAEGPLSLTLLAEGAPVELDYLLVVSGDAGP